jgi:hypothetical protein
MSKTIVPNASANPWYREPWPWLLMAGPGAVIIAGFVTAWLAVSTNDGLVAEDYYKKGLAAGQTIAQSDRARSLGLIARMSLTAETVRIRLEGRKEAGYVMPKALRITLSHPTRAGLDQAQELPPDGENYSGKLRLPASGHWLVLLEDDAKSWRLMGSVMLPASGETVIGGEAPADLRN